MRGPPTPALSPPASHTPLSLQRLCGSRRERGQGCSPRQREGVCCLVDQKHQRRKKTRAGGSHVRANGCRERTPPARALYCVAHVRALPNGGGGGGERPLAFAPASQTDRKQRGGLPPRIPPPRPALHTHHPMRGGGGCRAPPTKPRLTSITPSGPTALISAGVASPGLAPALAPAGDVVDTPRAPATRAARVARRRRAALLEDIVVFFRLVVVKTSEKKRFCSTQPLSAPRVCVYLSTL